MRLPWEGGCDGYTALMPQRDVYISADVESDGPIPGPFSMLSFGLAVAARFDGTLFEPEDPQKQTFYCELQPISSEYRPEALAVSQLDRERLKSEGELAEQAMLRATAWTESVSRGDRPVLVGFPLVFDWMFLYWYFQRFTGDSPFDFSAGLDMKTMYQQKARVPLSLAGKDDLPGELKSNRTHTHNALDDAIEQADIFVKLFEWSGN
jgi:hypothetical protein